MVINKIILHWTAGAYGVIPMESDSYNFLIDERGNIIPGEFPAEAQVPPLRPGKYAAHTLNCNSNALGICVDAMAGAIERPFKTGKYPITVAQYRGLIECTAAQVQRFGLQVDRRTVLTHAEVQRTLGVPQRSKWDITWLPGMTVPGDAILVGDRIRDDVRRLLK